jgi:adenylate kinase family enzyme
MGCSNEKLYIINSEQNLICKDESQKYQIILIIKTPCSSMESTLYRKICEAFNYKYLSIDDILHTIYLEKVQNNNINNDTTQLIENIKNGNLIPSKEMIKMLKNEIFKINNNKNLLIDGFPKNIENFEEWKNQMSGCTTLKKIIYIKINEEEIEKRINEKNEIEKYKNNKKLENQLNIFNNNIIPLIELIRNENLLIEIDGMKKEEEIFKNLYQKFIKNKLF